MEASRRQPAGESGQARGGCQQATASRQEQEVIRRKSASGRWMPAGDSQQAREDRQARDGSQQATASRREKEASRWKPAGGRWKPAGDSQHTRVDMLEVEANRQQPVGGSRKPAGESQQVEDGCQQATASRRERTDKLTRESRKPAGASQQVEGGCQQATASRREREQTSRSCLPLSPVVSRRPAWSPVSFIHVLVVSLLLAPCLPLFPVVSRGPPSRFFMRWLFLCCWLLVSRAAPWPPVVCRGLPWSPVVSRRQVSGYSPTPIIRSSRPLGLPRSPMISQCPVVSHGLP